MTKYKQMKVVAIYILESNNWKYNENFHYVKELQIKEESGIAAISLQKNDEITRRTNLIMEAPCIIFLLVCNPFTFDNVA